MFGAMIRAAERWRAIKTTDFERRQMAAVRQGSRGRGRHCGPVARFCSEFPRRFIQQISDLTLKSFFGCFISTLPTMQV
jgi:hypothetical protein